ncbi:hypothetical protein JKP88DRAFT_228365 [Tribonema minus]|uniref:Allatotropin n=1 Tax=Tribonema minus TaxID=303371 RepID=A0A835YI50_9STRA|nr:hypothetical protein JKP88DRAFT_228365 [Tribonema minus]
MLRLCLLLLLLAAAAAAQTASAFIIPPSRTISPQRHSSNAGARRGRRSFNRASTGTEATALRVHAEKETDLAQQQDAGVPMQTPDEWGITGAVRELEANGYNNGSNNPIVNFFLGRHIQPKDVKRMWVKLTAPEDQNQSSTDDDDGSEGPRR